MKIKNLLKILALATTLGATQATAQQAITHDEKIDCRDFKLTQSLYDCHPTHNIELNILPNQKDCVPRHQYESILRQLQECYMTIEEPAAADSIISELRVQYTDCKGEVKELKATLKKTSSELGSALTSNLNLKSLTEALQSQIGSQPVTNLDKVVDDIIDSQELAKYKITPEVEDTAIATATEEPSYFKPMKSSYVTPTKVDHQPLGNSIGLSAYVTGIGLNANLDNFTFGLGAMKANKDGELAVMTKPTENEPAPDFRTVYTERFSTQEETNPIAFLANVGYNFSKRFSLFGGAEFATREKSGNQTNTIDHYVDDIRISRVSEVIPMEGEKRTEVYPIFGARFGLSDRLSVEGIYSTSGQFLAGANIRFGGKNE